MAPFVFSVLVLGDKLRFLVAAVLPSCAVSHRARRPIVLWNLDNRHCTDVGKVFLVPRWVQDTSLRWGNDDSDKDCNQRATRSWPRP